MDATFKKESSSDRFIMIDRQFELWPCHPKPLQDELLSCWIVRIAHAHRLKVQTFCERVFGKDRQIWNRDIDRLVPRWAINRLSIQTGTPLGDAYKTGLTDYRGLLYPRRKISGILQWILPLEVWHRKRLGHGMLFCPKCLAEDPVPYFRKRWRTAIYTFCTKHNSMLHDRCPSCASGVAYHRIELGRHGHDYDSTLAYCHNCGFDLRRAAVLAPVVYEPDSFILSNLLHELEIGQRERFDAGHYNVIHQFCKIIQSNTDHIKLRAYLVQRLCVEDMKLPPGRISFEERTLSERHHVIQLAMWLMRDSETRIPEIWKAKAVRYNVLKRDFRRMPKWYSAIVEQCKDWRSMATKVNSQG